MKKFLKSVPVKADCKEMKIEKSKCLFSKEAGHIGFNV